MIYLLVTIHGWNPDKPEIRQEVVDIIVLVEHKLAKPALLRTVVWPFCVAGCLAGRGQEAFFRRQAQLLQPSGLFVTVRKALEIMEAVWKMRDENRLGDTSILDMASCFRATGEVLFLI
jgi:hypothetical protein